MHAEEGRAGTFGDTPLETNILFSVSRAVLCAQSPRNRRESRENWYLVDGEKMLETPSCRVWTSFFFFLMMVTVLFS